MLKACLKTSLYALLVTCLPFQAVLGSFIEDGRDPIRKQHQRAINSITRGSPSSSPELVRRSLSCSSLNNSFVMVEDEQKEESRSLSPHSCPSSSIIGRRDEKSKLNVKVSQKERNVAKSTIKELEEPQTQYQKFFEEHTTKDQEIQRLLYLMKQKETEKNLLQTKLDQKRDKYKRFKGQKTHELEAVQEREQDVLREAQEKEQKFLTLISDQIKQHADEINRQSALYQQAMRELQERENNIRQEVQKKEEELNNHTARSREELERQTFLYNDLRRQLDVLSNTSLEEKRVLIQNISQKETQIQEFRTAIETARTNQERIALRISEKEKDYNALNETHSSLKKDKESWQSKATQLEQEKQSFQTKMTQLQNEKQILETKLAQYDGYNRYSLSTIMTQEWGGIKPSQFSSSLWLLTEDQRFVVMNLRLSEKRAEKAGVLRCKKIQ